MYVCIHLLYVYIQLVSYNFHLLKKKLYKYLKEILVCARIHIYICMGMIFLCLFRSLRHPALVNVQTIYEANPEVVKLHDQRGWLPIHWCAYNCRETSVMKMLIREYDEACFMANKKGNQNIRKYCCYFS